MIVTVRSTGDIFKIDGVDVRLWRGRDDKGQVVELLVHRFAIHKSLDATEAERDLLEADAPKSIERAPHSGSTPTSGAPLSPVEPERTGGEGTP